MTLPLTGGIGIGGTQVLPGAVAVTIQHARWTVGQPLMTIHTAESSVTTPLIPGGYATPPSATAANSGVLQLVTATKVYTSLTGAFPELPVFSILNLHFFGTSITPVTVDIKPGPCPNSFNRQGNGVLRVAVAGAADFDATQVDLSEVEICRLDEHDNEIGCVGPNEGAGPQSKVVDLIEPSSGGAACECEKLKGDGIPDLSLYFRTAELVEALQLDALPGGALPELVVRGATYDGVPFQGSDCVRLVPPGSPPGLARMSANVSGAWIEVSPLDDQLDGGGFTPLFERSYPQSTQVTVKAAARHKGRTFVGWKVDGGPLTPETNTTLPFLVAGEVHTLEAVYEARQRGCGLGAELALLVPSLLWLYRRHQRSRS